MMPSTTRLTAGFSYANAGQPQSPQHDVPPGRAGSPEAAPQNSHDGSNDSETSVHDFGSAASMSASLSAPGLDLSKVDVLPYPAMTSGLPASGCCSASAAGA